MSQKNNGSSETRSRICSHVMPTSQKNSRVNHLKIWKHRGEAIRMPACKLYFPENRVVVMDRRKPNCLDKKTDMEMQTPEFKHKNSPVNCTGKLVNTEGITNVSFSFELSQWCLDISQVVATKFAASFLKDRLTVDALNNASFI